VELTHLKVVPTKMSINDEIISWNYRGIGGRIKVEAIMDLNKIEKPTTGE
jgi:hypothetical protein